MIFQFSSFQFHPVQIYVIINVMLCKYFQKHHLETKYII